MAVNFSDGESKRDISCPTELWPEILTGYEGPRAPGSRRAISPALCDPWVLARCLPGLAAVA